ncbi:helix-turn-helix domain-containing protein [Chitinophaga sp. YIM B06452]|uniref:winged helix-turn-helix transcriptional regulator n=1 Tax=Chitinophaga sp. YIM B06452 TaxID=3082158 RepID=UPI0031FE91D5
MNELTHNVERCKSHIGGVQDALYAIGGKWKLLVISALLNNAKRFNEIERSIDGITPKVLSKELKDLELNGFVKRIEVNGNPGQVSYELTPYSESLKEIVNLLSAWGRQHRKHVLYMSKLQLLEKELQK